MSGEENNQVNDAGGDKESIEGEIEQLRLSVETEEAKARGDQPGAGDQAADAPLEGEVLTPGDRFENNVRMLAQAIEILFRTVAMIKNREHWEVTEEEAKNAAVPTAQVIKKYFGDIDIGPELSLALEFGILIGTRMMLDAKLDQVDARRARGKEEGEQ